MQKAGIALLELFDRTDPLESALPDSIRAFLENFAVTGLDTTRSDGAIFYHGQLRPLDDTLTSIPTEFNIDIGRLSLPLLQSGIPFQLSIPRVAVAGNVVTGALETNPGIWHLDLMLDAFTLDLDGLEPAIFVPDSSTAPRHLLRDPDHHSVRITGSTVLRLLRATANGPVTTSFIDQADPLEPFAFSGAVASLVVTPPHFFIGSSEFGLSVGKLSFDSSDRFSPPAVLENDQSATWRGVAIHEATFYAPRNLPGIGDLSGGVRNVLIGSTGGLQGELEIQFGRSTLAPSAFQFEQVVDSGRLPLGTTPFGTIVLQAGQSSRVELHAGFVAPAPPADDPLPAGALQDWHALWTWPDGSTDTGDSSSGAVRHGQSLKIVPVEIVTVGGDAQEFRHPEISFRFIAAGTSPTINASIGSESFSNVTQVGGTAADMAALTLEGSSNANVTSNFTWQIDGQPDVTSGDQFVLDVGELSGRQFVILRELIDADDERLSRIRLEIHDDGDFLIGCENGVFAATDASTALGLASVENTFDLGDFHAAGDFNVHLDSATLDDADQTTVIVPDNALAEVTIDGAITTAGARDRHVQILMNFDSDGINGWGVHRPAGIAGADDPDDDADLVVAAFSQSDLLAWAARYPGARFLIIGRCGDLGPADHNRTLADSRAVRGESLMSVLEPGEIGTTIDTASLFRRGEQSLFSTSDGDALEENVDLQLDTAEKSEAVGETDLHGGWLIKAQQDRTGWPEDRSDAAHEAEKTRVKYRRVDIYAVEGTPSGDSLLIDESHRLDPSLRRSLVPAASRELTLVPPGSPSIDYRVKLRVVWDSPSLIGLKEAIPTLAEAEFVWTPTTSPLPLIDGNEKVELSRETLTIFANWAHDTRTGFTKATLGITSDGDPDGLVSTENKSLTAALAFGPALLSGVNPADQVIDSGARMAALLAAVGFANADFGGGESLFATGSSSALLSAAIETEMRAISNPGPDLQFRIITDYVCTLHINAGVLGIATDTDHPLKIRYRDVGIEYDTSATGWDRFGLVYDSTSMEIEDPGRWRINGVLGELLRIVEVTVGRGSIWFEGRMAIALEIGVIEITEAIIRLTFHDDAPPPGLPEFELRGLVMKANVPGVLEGEGRLQIDNDGTIRAAIAGSLIPLGLGVDAGLALGRPESIKPSVFMELFLGVQFATPLPLLQSGLAIYGLKGLFVMNGRRDIEPEDDPVQRELDWWVKDPGTKFTPERDQYAVGVGVVVGTLPDVSFCLSCAGMVVVAFPDTEVILGVDVNIVEVPDTTASDQGSPSGTITGLIVIDSDAVTLAVSARYTIPKIMEVNVPFAGYFPFPATPGDVYVRIGSDGEAGRSGEPVTLTLLPGTLDVRAWTYLMIEEGGLQNLGGDPQFSFDGFSVGFGAGWEIDWSAGPISLFASAKVLLGFGTSPLLIKGGVFVDGELDLVVVSISASGSLVFELQDRRAPGSSNEDDIYLRLDGEFCGEVDLFLFSLSGCVGVSFGDDEELVAPPPPSPVKGISLTDRRDRIMGTATSGDTPMANPVFDVENPENASAIDDNHTVWPDTAPVIHFSHYVQNALPPESQFIPGPAPSQPEWWGSNGLKYAYRLDSITLVRARDGLPISGDAPLQSVWASTPYRQPDSSGVDNPLPSEHEGPNLKLLDWDPWSWVVNLDDGGAGSDGDPAETIENLCDRPRVPSKACVFGRDARRAGLYKVHVRQSQPALPPYPSRFSVVGEPVIRRSMRDPIGVAGRGLHSLLDTLGAQLVPGAIVSLPFATDVMDETLEQGYRLPAARRTRHGGFNDITLPWRARFDRQVQSPSVLLLVCDLPDQADQPGGGHNDPKPPDERCVDFLGVRPEADLQRFDHLGLSFSPVQSGDRFTLSDQVDERVSPAVSGSDGTAEVRIPQDGLEIRLPRPCQRVEIHLMQFGGGVKGEAFAANGQRLDGSSTSDIERVPLVLRFVSPNEDGIARIQIFGGNTEAHIYRICCFDDVPADTPHSPGDADDVPSHLPGDIDAPGLGGSIDSTHPSMPPNISLLPDGFATEESKDNQFINFTDSNARIRSVGSVQGLVDGGPSDTWHGTPVPTQHDAPFDHTCTLIEYKPRPGVSGPWNGFAIQPLPGTRVILIAVCGIDQRVIDNRADDATLRTQLQQTLRDTILAEPDKRREIVLVPGEEYEIAVDWSWASFRPENPNDTPPDSINEDDWTKVSGDTVYRFKTATDHTVATTPSDGLNEYRFDARDISRYLIGLEPADARAVQFTGDPVWLHFDNGHVEQLLEQYGRNLSIDIHRTDPPPQPSGNLLAALQPIELTRDWYAGPDALQNTGKHRLDEAVLHARCLPDGSPFAGASLALIGDLDPDADYDLSVLAPRLDGRDPARVLATRFHTSRYATPRAFIDALGFPDSHIHPYLPDDFLIPADLSLPTERIDDSDRALDDALAAIDADTLPLPTGQPRTWTLWSGSVDAGWILQGVLIDSLEPLKRVRTVIESGAIEPSIGTRLELTHAKAGTTDFLPLRNNSNCTRMLLTPSSSLSLGDGIEHELSLHFDSSDGPLSGSRRLQSVPSIVVREGL